MKITISQPEVTLYRKSGHLRLPNRKSSIKLRPCAHNSSALLYPVYHPESPVRCSLLDFHSILHGVSSPVSVLSTRPPSLAVETTHRPVSAKRALTDRDAPRGRCPLRLFFVPNVRPRPENLEGPFRRASFASPARP